VSASIIRKRKSLARVGRNISMASGTQELIWNGPADISAPYTDTGLSTNAVDTIVSTGADTQTMVIEGHTIDGSGDFTFVVQTVTLNGQTEVTLPTPLARTAFLYNAGTTPLVGVVSLFVGTGGSTNGVPDVDADVAMQIPAGRQQSNVLATTLSKRDYWLITSIDVGVARQQTGSVDFELQVRRKGGVYREIAPLTASRDSGLGAITYRPFKVIPSNADVRLVGTASANGIRAIAEIQGLLAIDLAQV